MKYAQKCPECAGQKFMVTPKFREPQHDAPVQSVVLPVLRVHPRERGFFAPDPTSFGHFEVWTCLRCGLTAFYASGLPQDIESIVKQYPDQVSIVDATPKDGPYR